MQFDTSCFHNFPNLPFYARTVKVAIFEFWHIRLRFNLTLNYGTKLYYRLHLHVRLNCSLIYNNCCLSHLLNRSGIWSGLEGFVHCPFKSHPLYDICDTFAQASKKNKGCSFSTTLHTLPTSYFSSSSFTLFPIISNL